ncbi:hypothetical protein F7725_027190 [Dissostichus mawsoni]|uniref:Uncharacterized protein n=1 Tax=Dissostichus mawsoni TaxID=36200 RepID=A0A7J5XC70_DISMA|nr:hypothetical protein F7725_027190 [Dissostichus mawsoni]
MAPAKQKQPHSTPLSLEQIFSQELLDVYKDVSVSVQIDIFEQQFRSISKIDFMERYLSET